MSEMTPSKPENREMPKPPGTGHAVASPMAPPPPPFNTPAGDGSAVSADLVSKNAPVGGEDAEAALANKLTDLAVQEGGKGETEGGDIDMDDEDDDEGDEVDLPPEVMKRLYELKALQSEKDIVYEKYKTERAKLERKFASEYGAIYIRRAEIVTGRQKNQDDGAGEDAEEEGSGVPHFWMQCMLHHEALHDVVCEPDLEALYYLTDVRCVDKDDLLGFTLEFYFDANPFFSNAVLKKRYDTANIMDQGEPLLEGVEGTKIEWKAGRNLCEKNIRRKVKLRGGRSGETRTVTKVEKTESFFKFFQNPVMYDEDDEDEEEQYNFSFDMDYEVARIFRNHLIPNAVLWFTGEAVSEEDDDDDEDDDEDDEGEDEDDGIVEAEGEAGGGATGMPPKVLNFQAPAGFGVPP